MKYKLIKEYPGSPSLGFIPNFDQNGEEWNTPSLITEEDCKEYPEFWEKVVEKEYEILSFISNYVNTIINKDKNNRFPSPMCDRSFTLSFMLEATNYKIHSVKRLSDGEVFTVGDRLYLGKDRPNEVLEEIRIINGHIRFRMKFQFDLSHSWSSSYTLSFIQQAEQPLFTTHDGVDIYKGDKYCFVHKDTYGRYVTNLNQRATDGSGNKGGLTYFSTKEKAEDWILMNKPCLSINDVTMALFGTDVPNTNWAQDKLKNYIKNK